MKFDSLILIFCLLLFGFLVISFVYFFPILFSKLRAKSYGLILNYQQSKHLVQCKCVNKDFFKAVIKIWQVKDVPIDNLTFHLLAGGNLEKVYNGMIIMRDKGKDIDFRILSTLDLAGRDINLEIDKAEKNNWIFRLDE